MSVTRTIWNVVVVVVIVVVVVVVVFWGGGEEGVINVACYTSTV